MIKTLKKINKLKLMRRLFREDTSEEMQAEPWKMKGEKKPVSFHCYWLPHHQFSLRCK